MYQFIFLLISASAEVMFNKMPVWWTVAPKGELNSVYFEHFVWDLKFEFNKKKEFSLWGVFILPTKMFKPARMNQWKHVNTTLTYHHLFSCCSAASENDTMRAVTVKLNNELKLTVKLCKAEGSCRFCRFITTSDSLDYHVVFKCNVIHWCCSINLNYRCSKE